MDNQIKNEKIIIYPSEITFKAIFRNRSGIIDDINKVLNKNNIEGKIEKKESKGSKFISFTITAEFPSENILNITCSNISGIKNYMSLF